MDCDTEMKKELLRFIDKSKSPYHAVANLKEMVVNAGYIELKENEDWDIKVGCKYFVIRNDSTIAVFSLPDENENKIKGFNIVAAHSDSPTFKVKENPEMETEKQYIRINTEKYGGMIMSSWFDRPLSVAGRIAIKKGGKIVTKLVDVDKDLLVIPNVAIHMNRDINNDMKYDAQTDTIPLYGAIGGKRSFMEQVALSAGVHESDILGHDLFLYVREKGRIIGGNGEYILSPKLDDLQCAFSAMKAMVETEPKSYINMAVVFDNEEVGSGTRQGADSTFLEDVLTRIKESLGKNNSWMCKMLADSFMISADNAHAVHPNHPEHADPVNRPYLNGGIVIKYHGGQKYTTDGFSAAKIKSLCKMAKVPYQIYTNKSNKAGGSTLGNISEAHLSMPSADIGLPQLAMHSAVETGGVKDVEYAVKMMKALYGL